MTNERQTAYLNLIEQLLKCPSGQEPEVLNAQPDLLDADLIKLMIQVATMLAHEGNAGGAQCLMHVARELSIQLGLYPKLTTS